MSPTTDTRPLTEPVLWRRLLARCHPDSGGDDALFVWATALREHFLGSGTGGHARRDPSSPGGVDGGRLPFEPNCAPGAFDGLTDEALAMAREVEEPYSSVLVLLEDCWEQHNGPVLRQQGTGATYRQLALIAHLMGMSKAERVRFYSIARSIPLSAAHAGQILSRVKRKAA